MSNPFAATPISVGPTVQVSRPIVSALSAPVVSHVPKAPTNWVEKVHISANAQQRRGIPAQHPAIQQAFAQAPMSKAEHDFGQKVVQAGNVAPASFPAYGKDFVTIVLEGRTSEDHQASLQDPFVSYVAEKAVLDRYKPILEEQVKTWLPFLKRSSFDTADGKGFDLAVALDFKQNDLIAPLEDEAALRFFKPTIGLKLADFSTAGIFAKPGMDLVTYRNQQNTEVTLYAGAPINLKGKIYPEAALHFTQGLVNPPTHTEKALFLDASTIYDGYASDGTFQLGLRQQFNQDTHLSLYGRTRYSFTPENQHDFGVAAYLGHRFN